MTNFEPLPSLNSFNLKLPKSQPFETNLEGYEAWANFLRTYAGCKNFRIFRRNLMTNCPFHPDKKPSFGLIDTDDKRTYYCFSCGATGSLKQLVTEITRDPNAWKKRKADLKPPTEIDQTWGYYQFTEFFNPDITLRSYNEPCDYWQSRGLTEATVSKYQLGAGQLKLLFPVWDIVWHRYVGVCEREWDTHPNYPALHKTLLGLPGISKYRFQSGVKRNQSIFGANFIQARNEIYVFEGAIDCMNHWQRTGLPSVATWGKDLSAPQLEYLGEFQEVILCPDKDLDRGGLFSAEKTEAKLAGRTNVSIALLAGPYKDYSEAVALGTEPKLKLLPSAYEGRMQEVGKLYRLFRKGK